MTNQVTAYIKQYRESQIIDFGISVVVLWCISMAMSYIHQLSMGGVCFLKLGILFIGGILFWVVSAPTISKSVSQVKKQTWPHLLKLTAISTLGILILCLNQVVINGIISGVMNFFFGCEDTFGTILTNPIQNNILANSVIFGLISFTSWKWPFEKHSKPTWLMVKNGTKESKLQIEDIAWIETDRNCLTIHTRERKYVVYSSLKKFNSDYLDNQFVQIHRSKVVNKNWIANFCKYRSGDGVVKLTNGQELKYSRSFKSNIVL